MYIYLVREMEEKTIESAHILKSEAEAVQKDITFFSKDGIPYVEYEIVKMELRK